MVVNAVLSFLLFKDHIKINNRFLQRVIHWLSNVSFGVYIIHAHPMILDTVLYKSDYWNRLLCSHGVISCLGLITVSVFFIYLICGLAEQMCKWFFDVVRISELCSKLDKKLFTLINIERGNT